MQIKSGVDDILPIASLISTGKRDDITIISAWEFANSGQHLITAQIRQTQIEENHIRPLHPGQLDRVRS